MPWRAATLAALASAALAQAPLQWLPDHGMPPGFQGRLAYDSARERMVLCGAPRDPSGRLWRATHTFEWHGSGWAARHEESGQWGELVMAFDPVRRQVLRATGSRDGLPSGAVAAWDGFGWTPVGSGLPIARTWAAGAWHAATGALLVHGGNGPSQSLALRGDTWLLQGAIWTPLPSSGPAARMRHAIAYDARRQRTVLFGGVTGGVLPGNYPADTWTFDGTAWAPQAPAVAPPPRTEAACAFDPGRGVVVLFGGSGLGGLLADTWTWDGSTWSMVATAAAPTPRADAAMAADHGRGEILLFGGRDGSGVRTDTWSWNGSRWQPLDADRVPALGASPAIAYDPAAQQAVWFDAAGRTWLGDGQRWRDRTPALSPPPRVVALLAYDSWRQRLVLHGGQATYPLTDTWEWDGSRWLPQASAVAPPARIRGSLAFDGARGVAVLFGGQSLSAGALADTWEWQGAGWVQRSPSNAPRPGGGQAMAFDARLGRVVLFGGSTAAGPVAELWHYDGVDWQLQVPAGIAPPPRYDPALAYDVRRQRLVLVGGNDLGGNGFGDGWEWDGSAWTPLPVAGLPPQVGARLYDDHARDRLVLLGGYSLNHFESPWLLTAGPAAAASVVAAGCGVPPPRLAAAAPLLGSEGDVEIAAAPGCPVVLVGSPQGAAVSVLGCVQAVAQPFTTVLATTNAAGVAHWPLPVPAVAALRGATIHLQAVVFDGTGPVGGSSWSNGLRCVAGE